MAKRKNGEESESALLEENRELRATIKSLRKKLKRLTHLETEQDDTEEAALIEQALNQQKMESIAKKALPTCPDCGAENIVTVKIAGRQFQKCGAVGCKWRNQAIKDDSNGSKS